MGSGRFHDVAGVTLLILVLAVATPARAEYFSRKSFKSYEANGTYPFWSKTWVELEPRVYRDVQGIPYVNYRTGPSYNTTTVSLFALQAFNKWLESRREADNLEFLKLADWILAHQNPGCGCWLHDMDWKYVSLDVNLHPPWSSAMTQGLAISVLTRAHRLTGDEKYLRAAHEGLQPFTRKVEDGGVLRPFSLGALSGDPEPAFYEEYPTQPYPSFTLNGFMFSLIGLYDLASLSDSEARVLFEQGAHTLRIALPLYDDGDGSSYDLVHLTRPPRPVHRDASYHLVHITLLNALSSATGDKDVVWYRDHWNSFGLGFEPSFLWFQHFGIWLIVRHVAVLILGVLLLICVAALRIRSRRGAKRSNLLSPVPFSRRNVVAS